MSKAKPLDYAGRCARYLPQRGIPYDPERLSIGHLTPRQRRRALKKERQAMRGWTAGEATPRRTDARAARLERRRG